jgi:circadian clock protein KaiC
MERVRTGISGLDDLIEGGLPKKSVTLISGPPGSGKTILCYNFLANGLELGDKCLFLTTDKKAETLITQAKELGFDFQSAIEKNKLKFVFLDINKRLVYDIMTKEILSGEYNRVVLDTVTTLSDIPIYIEKIEITDSDSIPEFDDFPSSVSFKPNRLRLYYIKNLLDNANCTSLITSELHAGSFAFSRDGISEFLVDGIILLNFDATMDKRKISVMKMRTTKHTMRSQDIRIGEGGITLV